MPRDLGLTARLRKWVEPVGARVIEVAGWQVRGSATFYPRGSVDHHTAGPRTGNAPSLGICINGRSGLPGPLCNCLQARDNTVYVVAAGRANHAGLGGWQGLGGNSTVYGLERENVGTTAEPWRPDQHEVAARVHCAFLEGTPGQSPTLVCEHKEWAPTRKIDAHTIAGDAMRLRVRELLLSGPGGAPPVPAPQEDDVPPLPVTYTGSGALWVPEGGGKAVRLNDLSEVEACIQLGILAREGWGQNPGMPAMGKITHKELDPDLFNRLYPTH
jgi:hypothetical protein